MKMIANDGSTMVFVDGEKRVVIERNGYNNSKTAKYNVWMKTGTDKGRVIATRCNLDKALEYTK